MPHSAHHFLFTPLGSLGDLHPYLAVGLGLAERGHHVTIATSESYRHKVEGEGLQFRPLRPDVGVVFNNPETVARACHPRTGAEYIFRKLFLPWLEQGYEDTLAAARDADLLIGHCIAFGTPIAAEVLGKPWVSAVLQPSLFFTVNDPPTIAAAPWLRHIFALGPGPTRALFGLMHAEVRRWGRPLNAFRARLGLPELRNPLLHDMLSPHGTQAWFSRLLAAPQPDWPPSTTVTGFAFYDKLLPGQGLSPELAAFLAAGPPPVVFTLGSTAVFDAGQFYAESAKAAKHLGVRAVLLTGGDERNRPAGPPSDEIHCEDYAPYSELFHRSAAVVHQGGVGTTAQGMLSGKPSLIVPYSNDQPDNAMRIARLGSGRFITRQKYNERTAAAELKTLLNEGGYRTRALEVAAEVRKEKGVETACDGLIALLDRNRRG